jgi:hypothetical protein
MVQQEEDLRLCAVVSGLFDFVGDAVHAGR